MIRQIVIEAELPDDAQSAFRLSINANLIAKGVTAAQAYYLVGEVLRRIGSPERAEAVMFDADGDASESVRVTGTQAETLGVRRRRPADKRVRVQQWREKARAARRGRNFAAVSKTRRPGTLSTLARRASCKRGRNRSRMRHHFWNRT
jgi:hypothetical protein